MEYRIRIQPGKEKAFQEFLKALRTLGVVEEVKMATEAESQKEREEKQGSSPEELASQYRDLVD
ncbi:MAG: hypothetical protein J5I94_12130 [Phaeodactylibacter sp.]|nr:hypothetical protein [Phaeodactylibacter sp.]